MKSAIVHQFIRKILLMFTFAFVALAGCKKAPTPGKEPGTEQYQDSIVFSQNANCYIVSKAGTYTFRATKGCSGDFVGDVRNVVVLWETFGTDVQPNVAAHGKA